MSINIPEGKYQGTPTAFEFGQDSKGATVIKITMKVAEGPYAGQTAQFKNGFGEKAVKYTKRALLALGWQGKDIATAKEDILKTPKTVGMEVNIAEYEDRRWSSIRSIGYAGEALKPADASTVKDVNSWLAEVPEEKPADDSGLPF